MGHWRTLACRPGEPRSALHRDLVSTVSRIQGVREFQTSNDLLSKNWAGGSNLGWQSGNVDPGFRSGPNSVRAEIPPRLGLHSAFGFPIQFHGEILGVLNFFSAEIRQPDTDSMATLTALGG